MAHAAHAGSTRNDTRDAGLDPDLRMAGIILALGMMIGAFIPNRGNDTIVSASPSVGDQAPAAMEQPIIDPLARAN